MAFENVSKNKLIEYQEKKKAEKQYADEIRKAKELADRREALERMAVINKDMIDFAHPDITQYGTDEQPVSQKQNQPDEEA